MREVTILLAFGYGLLFFVSPCVLPLIPIYLAARGALLLAVYSLGLGLPFLAAGFALDYLRPLLRRIGRYAAAFYIVSGASLIAVGLLLVTDRLSWFLGLL